MTTRSCPDFEHLVNAQLDARAASPPELDDALARHAASCARCREIDQRYRALRRALDAWERAPVPPDGLVERILAAHAAAPASRTVAMHRLPPRAWWSAAAALVVVAFGGLAWMGWFEPGGSPAPRIAEIPEPVEVRPVPRPSPLTVAWTEATAATLELALETSAPAARVGRGMLASAAASRERFSTPSIAPGSPPDLLHSLEEEVTQGMRPLSGSARSAFSFLMPANVGG